MAVPCPRSWIGSEGRLDVEENPVTILFDEDAVGTEFLQISQINDLWFWAGDLIGASARQFEVNDNDVGQVAIIHQG